MAKRVKSASAAAPGVLAQEIVPGSVRPCSTYRGELARHRVITADGADYLITTADERRQGRGYVTAAYPVARGYLIMMRQPLCALESLDEAAALRQHALLLDVMVESGTGVVRARRRSAAFRRAERTVETVTVEAAPAMSAAFHLSDLVTVAEMPVASGAVDA
ncbi:MAG TPA: hypothetical protein VID73_07135 [Ktedonobacterales bacterium]|jgi:hypothetical protein